METLSNITLGQALQNLTHNAAGFVVALIFLLILEAVARQVAVNHGYKKTVNFCDRIAVIITFILEVAKAFFNKIPPKALPAALLVFGLVFSSGCAMIPPHAINIDIKGHNLETPYGKIEDGEIHVHSMWGSKSQVITTPVSPSASSSASASTSIPVTVTVTPKT